MFEWKLAHEAQADYVSKARLKPHCSSEGSPGFPLLEVRTPEAQRSANECILEDATHAKDAWMMPEQCERLTGDKDQV